MTSGLRQRQLPLSLAAAQAAAGARGNAAGAAASESGDLRRRSPDVVAIVLAAGSSSRLGRPKQDVVFEGETLLARATRIAREVTDEVIVVTRENNAEADEGIASSIRAGVRQARKEARILITLCDQPLVTAAHLRALISVDAPIVASGYRGIAAVPAVFAPRFRDELLALRGDRGARLVIDAHRGETIVIPFEDAAVDIDKEEDLLTL